MSFQVEIGLFLRLCRGMLAVLVLESSRDGISTLTYFSQNRKKNKKFFVNKFTK